MKTPGLPVPVRVRAAPCATQYAAPAGTCLLRSWSIFLSLCARAERVWVVRVRAEPSVERSRPTCEQRARERAGSRAQAGVDPGRGF